MEAVAFERSPWALETRNLGKEFLGFKAVTDVNLKVRRGTIHALIGPNGAGKTTMFNLLTRFTPSTSGSIFLDGRDITGDPPAKVARAGMIRSFQISAIFPELTVLDNVKIALQAKHGLAHKALTGSRATRHLDEPAMALLDQLGLAGSASLVARDLPYGQRRSVELATTLAMDPRVMLLDEPTQGMGVEDVEAVAALIRKVAVNRTVVIVEHNLKVVASLSDQVTVLARGSVLAEGSYADISKDSRVLTAYIGADHAG